MLEAESKPCDAGYKPTAQMAYFVGCDSIQSQVKRVTRQEMIKPSSRFDFDDLEYKSLYPGNQ